MSGRRAVWEQRDGYLMMEPGEIVQLENPLRVQIRALREDPLINGRRDGNGSAGGRGSEESLSRRGNQC